MRLKKIIRAKKSVTEWGKWTTGKVMPKTAFPVSKAGNWRVRSAFSWRIVKFQSEGSSFRLLIFYRADKQEYAAWLACDDSGDCQVLARYEFHSSHPGWHIHAHCEMKLAPVGRTLIDGPRILSHRTDFSVTSDEKALYIAAKAFGLPKEDVAKPIANEPDLFDHGH